MDYEITLRECERMASSSEVALQIPRAHQREVENEGRHDDGNQVRVQDESRLLNCQLQVQVRADLRQRTANLRRKYSTLSNF
ncbi:hypothetical protein PGTUg99_036018 [Puccinia graminis f. sp. tritici]|uniref:Uncharacterized protein n=1 Tax=Puccinia graminis f. sp. tritici TaxID=56615 RepID=A0A5B0NLG5_PUCGR|nr:hypothetical protein PGTUg99_036018 [Puccinia graminis f. sp. tritici]